jgi:hypothetical protein
VSVFKAGSERTSLMVGAPQPLAESQAALMAAVAGLLTVDGLLQKA